VPDVEHLTFQPRIRAQGTAARRQAAGLAVLGALAIGAVGAACGAGGHPARPAAAITPTPTPTSTATPATTPVTGMVTIAVTPEAIPVLAIAIRAIRTAQPAVQLHVQTVPPTALATVLHRGGPTMVVSSDQATLAAMAQESLIYQPVPFVRTKLQLVVAYRDPLGIRSLADLEKPQVRTVLVAPSTLTGQASSRLLGAAGVSVPSQASVATPAAAVAAIQAGQADASLLEVPDAVAAGSAIRAFDIPDADNVITAFSLGIPRTAGSSPLVQAIDNALLVGPGSQALVAAHYLLPGPLPTAAAAAGSGD
jgi:molybdate transport system substrate-binding protein